MLASVRKEVSRLLKETKAARAKADPRKKYQDRLAKLAQQETNTVDAIVKMGINDALQKRLSSISAEKAELEAQMAVTPKKLDQLPDIVPRELERIRRHLNLHTLLESKRATAVQVARARSALRSVLGDMKLVPDYDTGHLVAHLQVNQKALALICRGASASMVNMVAGAGFGTLQVVFSLVA
jgi:hypothetical protein